MRLATHNSATGEHPLYLIGWLGLPFARCQAKTLAQQIEAGVRLFDIRVRWHCDNLQCAHGLLYFDKTLYQALHEINRARNMADERNEPCYVMVTYEGTMEDEDHDDFVEEVKSIFAYFPSLILTQVAVKLPTWYVLYSKPRVWKQSAFVCDYPKLTRWKALLPIPWLWKRWQKYTPANRLFGKFSMRDFV